jgi:hypothetical protein
MFHSSRKFVCAVLCGASFWVSACSSEAASGAAVAATAGTLGTEQAAGVGTAIGGAGAAAAGQSGAAGAAAMSGGATAGTAGAAGRAASAGAGPAAASGASGSANSNAGGASGAVAGSGTSGTSGTSGMAGATATPAALGPDCGADPLASKQPYGSGFYQQFSGLFGCTAAADVALFRKMLPEKFEMPADPKVCFYMIDFIISSVGRYHEAAILLPTTYKGESGKYVLTMDLDNTLAITGGRAVGFPKYRGQVELANTGNDWTGTASANGSVDLKVTYKAQCNKTDEFQWPDFLNITPIPSGTTSSEAFLPPRTGSVLKVPAEYLTPPAFYSLKGTVTLEIKDDKPWNGLIDESKPFPGLWTTFVGGIDLGNQPLD